MYDPAPRRGPATPQEWFFTLILIALFLGLFIAEICNDYTPVKLSALLIVLCWVPLLVLHEAGHAAAAILLGWHVGRIVIGMGRTLTKFRIGSALVELRPVPTEGFISCVPTNLRWPHLKSALIFFAGPGVELLLAGGILWGIGADTLFSRSNDYWIIFWQSVAAAATVQAVLNLMPHVVRNSEGETASDGVGIIRSFRAPEAYYASLIGNRYNEQEQEWNEYDSADWWTRDQ